MNDINKRLCELLGIEPEIYDYQDLHGNVLQGEGLPDFFSAEGRVILLKRLNAKGCVYEFLAKFAFPADFIGFLLNDTGALARVALEFLEASHES
jgi:hypothetical protein